MVALQSSIGLDLHIHIIAYTQYKNIKDYAAPMFAIFGSSKVGGLKPLEVHQTLKDEKFILVDVPEPDEFASARSAGAVHHPLSSFDPKTQPATNGRTIIMQSGSGIRSAKAVAQCQRGELEVENHLAGGVMAWKGSGLPTVSGPVTGKR